MFDSPVQHGPVVPPAPPPPPTPAPAAKPALDHAKISATANTLYKAIDGWWVGGDDRQKILDELRGKTPAEIEEIRRIYYEQRGRSLVGDLDDSLKGNDREEVRASMSGDAAQSVVASLQNVWLNELTGEVDNEKITRVLEGITDDKLRAQVKQHMGPALAQVQSGGHAALTTALLDGDKSKIAAVKVKHALSTLKITPGLITADVSWDHEGVFKALEGLEEEELKKVAGSYKGDLRGELTEKLQGPARHAALKFLAGDKTGALASRVKLGMSGSSKDREGAAKLLEDVPAAELGKMRKSFDEQYEGGWEGMLGKLGDLDRKRMTQLGTTGKLDDAFAMQYALNAKLLSNDVNMMKSVLGKLQKGDYAKLAREYQIITGGEGESLTERLVRLGGRDTFELIELAKGKPTSRKEAMERADARQRFERGSDVSNFFNDLFTNKGENYDEQHAKLSFLHDKIEAGIATPEEKEQFDRRVGYHEQDGKTFAEQQKKIADVGSKVVEAVVGGFVTMATGGLGAPVFSAMLSAGVGGVAGTLTRIAVQGKAVSPQDVLADLVGTATQVATAGTMGKLTAPGGGIETAAKKAAGTTTGQGAVTGAMTGTAAGAAAGATGAVVQGKSPEEVLQATVTGAVTGGAGGATSGALGAKFGQAKPAKVVDGKLKNPRLAMAGRAAATSAAGAAVGTALNPESYSGDALITWLQSVGAAGMQGITGVSQGAAGGFSAGTDLHKRQLRFKAQVDGMPKRVNLVRRRMLEKSAANLNVSPEVLPQLQSMQERLRQGGMTDTELKLWRRAMERDPQSTLSNAEVRARSKDRVRATHRRDSDGKRLKPPTPAELDAVLKANVLMYEMGFTGDLVTKMLNPGAVGAMFLGKNEAGYKPAVTGYVGRGSAHEGKTAAQKVGYVGQDYVMNNGQAPFVDRTAGKGARVKREHAERMWQVETVATPELAAQLKVSVGADVYAHTLKNAQKLAALKAKDPSVLIPGFLQLDAKGKLANVADPRMRTSGNDPYTGMGAPMSERLRDASGRRFLAESQEHVVQGAQKFKQGDELVAIDAKGNRKVMGTYDAKAERFIPARGLGRKDRKEIEKLMKQQEAANAAAR